jgi:hypothetical protein
MPFSAPISLAPPISLGQTKLSNRLEDQLIDAIGLFQKFIVAEGRNGLSSERLGEAVHLALSTAKPKNRALEGLHGLLSSLDGFE